LLSDSQLEQVRKFAEEVALREGCLLYDLEFHDGPNRALRVYIDREQGGVGIEDCSNVSRALNLRLDVEDVIPGGHYDLEVSSPGLDRKLSQLWHFTKALGQRVRLQTRVEDGTIKPFEGQLQAVEGSTLRLENASGPFEVEFKNVQKARVVLEDVMAKKPRPGKQKR
jgi:ribosome maturation factor RimP